MGRANPARARLRSAWAVEVRRLCEPRQKMCGPAAGGACFLLLPKRPLVTQRWGAPRARAACCCCAEPAGTELPLGAGPSRTQLPTEKVSSEEKKIGCC